jgi:hypothetical protein
MSNWSRHTFGSVRKEIKSLREALEEAKTRSLVSDTSREVRDLEMKLHELYESEEIMFKQRSRHDWLKAGDRNTRYFQNRATHRRRKNTVKFLLRPDGSRCDTDEGMREMAWAFYADLYTSEGSTDMNCILNQIEEFVTSDMNDELTAIVSDKEIEMALFQMGPTKSPGPDGLPALFFQRHWADLKGAIGAAVRDFFGGKGVSR